MTTVTVTYPLAFKKVFIVNAGKNFNGFNEAVSCYDVTTTGFKTHFNQRDITMCWIAIGC